jgi:hypothetical protein
LELVLEQMTLTHVSRGTEASPLENQACPTTWPSLTRLRKRVIVDTEEKLRANVAPSLSRTSPPGGSSGSGGGGGVSSGGYSLEDYGAEALVTQVQVLQTVADTRIEQSRLLKEHYGADVLPQAQVQASTSVLALALQAAVFKAADEHFSSNYQSLLSAHFFEEESQDWVGGAASGQLLSSLSAWQNKFGETLPPRAQAFRPLLAQRCARLLVLSYVRALVAAYLRQGKTKKGGVGLGEAGLDRLRADADAMHRWITRQKQRFSSHTSVAGEQSFTSHICVAGELHVCVALQAFAGTQEDLLKAYADALALHGQPYALAILDLLRLVLKMRKDIDKVSALAS